MLGLKLIHLSKWGPRIRYRSWFIRKHWAYSNQMHNWGTYSLFTINKFSFLPTVNKSINNNENTLWVYFIMLCAIFRIKSFQVNQLLRSSYVSSYYLLSKINVYPTVWNLQMYLLTMYRHTQRQTLKHAYIYIYIFFIYSVSSGNWSLVVRGKDQSLPDVSDGYNDTCHGLDIDGDGMLLKSDLDVPFKTLQVTVLIAGGEVVFFPSTDASRCKEHTSLLMTHDSSIAKARGQMCKPFCEVPGSCWLQERVILDTDKINYVFTCACPRTSCNELFVMFQSDAVPGSISICEVQLLYP